MPDYLLGLVVLAQPFHLGWVNLVHTWPPE